MTLRIAGVDEAGRGPLAGPVVVAAVVFAPGRVPVNGLDDSKALTQRKRELLYPRIIERALAWKIVFIEPGEIDRRNIYHATLHGMRDERLVTNVAPQDFDSARVAPGLALRQRRRHVQTPDGGSAQEQRVNRIRSNVSECSRHQDVHAVLPSMHVIT